MVATSYARIKEHEVDLNRTERLVLRISSQERKMFEKAAKNRFTNLSELVRQLLHREVETQTEKA